jgi:hypothetical protein
LRDRKAARRDFKKASATLQQLQKKFGSKSKGPTTKPRRVPAKGGPHGQPVRAA